MSWWTVPLVAYSRYSCDFQGGWVVKLLSTLTRPEKVGFGLALVVCGAHLLTAAHRDRARVTLLIFLGLYLLLFRLNDQFEGTIFMDPRIWPTIYFSGYALMIFGFDSIARSAPPPVVAAMVAPLWFFVPSDTAFAKAQSWMAWNYQGAGQARGWGDFRQVVDILRRSPPAGFRTNRATRRTARLVQCERPRSCPFSRGRTSFSAES